MYRFLVLGERNVWRNGVEGCREDERRWLTGLVEIVAAGLDRLTHNLIAGAAQLGIQEIGCRPLRSGGSLEGNESAGQLQCVH